MACRGYLQYTWCSAPRSTANYGLFCSEFSKFTVAADSTKIILALYYTIADIVLLAQFFYYEGFTLTDKVSKPTANGTNSESDERRPLLGTQSNGNEPPQITVSDMDARRPSSSFTDRLMSVDGTHLSPATPWVPESDPSTETPAQKSRRSPIYAVLFNSFAVVLVCLAGVLGWWLSNRRAMIDDPSGDEKPPEEHETLHFNILGQVFGYICAVLYLGSRLPQLLLNYRRKSTEGISMLFFLFACIGNLTYVLSIFAYSPVCKHPNHCRPGEAGAIYARYIAVNLSWLIGSLGTLVLDAGVFVQYFMYRKDEEDSSQQDHRTYADVVAGNE